MGRVPGFTLIELLVVLVVIGIATSTVVLSLTRQETPDQSLQQLRRLLELAAEKAEISGAPLAVDLVPGGYRFSRFDTRGRWQPLAAEDAMFSPRRLAPDLAWQSLEVDGVAVAPPRLVFASGMPEFVLRVAAPGGGYRLEGRISGAVDLSAEAEAP